MILTMNCSAIIFKSKEVFQQSLFFCYQNWYSYPYFCQKALILTAWVSFVCVVWKSCKDIQRIQRLVNIGAPSNYGALQKKIVKIFRTCKIRINRLGVQIGFWEQRVVQINTLRDLVIKGYKKPQGLRKKLRLLYCASIPAFARNIITKGGREVGKAIFVSFAKYLYENEKLVTFLIDKESKECIKAIIRDNYELQGQPFYNTSHYSRTLLSDINLQEYVIPYTLSISIQLATGINLYAVRDGIDLIENIIANEANMSDTNCPIQDFKDCTSVWQFLPLLRKLKKAYCQRERDNCIFTLYNLFVKRFEDRQQQVYNSFIGRVMRKLYGNYFNEEDIKFFLISIIHSAVSNSSNNFNYMMGVLSIPSIGYNLQRAFFKNLMGLNDQNLCLAWNNSALNLNSQYGIALLNESLRFFSSYLLSSTRRACKEFTCDGIIIPKGTIFFINMHEVFHDPEFFFKPMHFKPSRWLDDNRNDIEVAFTYSYRDGFYENCFLSLIMKELYTLSCRMILTFVIKRPTSNENMMRMNYPSTGLETQSIFMKKVTLRLEPRLHSGSDELYSKIFR